MDLLEKLRQEEEELFYTLGVDLATELFETLQSLSAIGSGAEPVDMREAFALHFEMPEDVYWDERLNAYHHMNWRAETAADLYQAKFDGWQAALSQQPESEPVFEIQHGPINDGDGHPEWARIESLGGWDEFNFAPGTKLYAGPPPVQQPESEPIAYISKIALEELQKPECSEDMFGVTGTPSGCWDVGLFLDPPPTVRVPDGLTYEMMSAGVAALEKSYAHEEAWSDTVRSVFNAMRSTAPSIAEPTPQVPEGWKQKLVDDYRREYCGQSIESWLMGLPDDILAAPSIAEQQEPDHFYMNDNDMDYLVECPYEIAEYHGACMNLDSTETVTISCWQKLPDRKMQIYVLDDGHVEWKWVE